MKIEKDRVVRFHYAVAEQGAEPMESSHGREPLAILAGHGTSPDCYSSNIGSLDVHYSSGVANHFFYLMAEGATTPAGFTVTPAQLVCNGNTSAGGIGRDAAQRIWYRALTVYMTSNTNYAGARAATLSAAADLYGSGSQQYNGVASAWSAVGVN